MRQKKLLLILGQLMMLFAVCMAPLVSQGCRTWWYQPKEPEGFTEFAKKLK